MSSRERQDHAMARPRELSPTRELSPSRFRFELKRLFSASSDERCPCWVLDHQHREVALKDRPEDWKQLRRELVDEIQSSPFDAFEIAE